ncbi:MAG TPA: 2-succinyl-5-enolpyruvyl-6-hydroxy-3-cyclohexene-1-carboxylic-acid synthase [Candidatus Bacteroides pullicola]|uniref:2-succinyl-5-enolpyruvyl-6-hydroxy-3-cyclohexene-1-carboxylate synthase n=1 Tax=Candidatus Bacteroides pullicola TaxID=2838475 RepID=A0A9D1ZJU2_9BACE|nr:2-succinyl-5-enolpyruvyl-6-hydroxy-3-cyclohexene-1-carboxylic-acid synthase [Candidatus Bacteroides pullicola]
MFTDKKNVLQLAALLAAHGIRKIVLCPGSRDIPLVRTFSAMQEVFTCYAVTDERSAGFFALGLSLNDHRPAAVCCTSGSALLNLHPAVAEAFYRQVPLVVISADRPTAWIGQMDGQTLPQPGVFGPLVRKSISLPEVRSKEDEWHCNRLINEALLETCHHGRGPVHINVPISEPFFDCPVESLPAARVITRKDNHFEELAARLRQFPRRMLLIGQGNPGEALPPGLEDTFICFASHPANHPGAAIRNVEPLLSALSPETKQAMRPDLVITCGGHILSKRLKQYLRSYPPKEHWHIAPSGEVADLFGALTVLVEAEPADFFRQVLPAPSEETVDYARRWTSLSAAIPSPAFPYSEMGAIGEVIRRLPTPCALHLANSSVVRYAQLFPLPDGVEVLSNRGTNGIEGSLSAAVGYAAASDKLNFVFIGDLSFFYDMNALWNPHGGKNLRILLLNNGGGEIFNALPGLRLTDENRRFVLGTHQTSAQGWAVDSGFEYLSARNAGELATLLPRFTAPDTTRPMLLEVFTDKDQDVQLLREYYHQLDKL